MTTLAPTLPQPDLFSRRTGGPKIAPDDSRIDQIVQFLKGRGWVHRDIVFKALQINDRVGRECVEQCGGLIISDSGKGYKYAGDATLEESDKYDAELSSRIAALTQRRLDHRNFRNQIGHAAAAGRAS